MDEPKSTGSNLTAELVERARQGDRNAYDALFRRAAERTLLYIRVRLGPKLRQSVDSLDVLQETYLAAHEDFSGFSHRGERAFSRWLCQVAERRIHGLVDHHGARKRTPPGEALPVSRLIDEARSEAGPMSLAAREEQRESLFAGLERLPEEEREALLLRYFEGLTIDDLAARMARSATAVRRLLGRAALTLGRDLRGLEREA